MGTRKIKHRQTNLHSVLVQKKIEEAINQGYSNNDPQVRAQWDALFGKDHKPTAEEFIQKISNITK